MILERSDFKGRVIEFMDCGVRCWLLRFTKATGTRANFYEPRAHGITPTILEQQSRQSWERRSVVPATDECSNIIDAVRTKNLMPRSEY